MTVSNPKMPVHEAADLFLASLMPEETGAFQSEIQRFVRWFGREKLMASLSPHEIANYAGRFSASDTDTARKLDIIRKFLAYARNEGWTASNLSVHLKIKKDKYHSAASGRQLASDDMAVLTKQGYADIQKEISALKGQRPQILEDIRRAAADKDFRENAPLHAAREQLGYIEGRIGELEAILKSANIVGQSGEARTRVTVGHRVVLLALASGKELCYTIVGPKEADPAKGKISHVSPIGKAIIGKRQGDMVEVVVPSGRVCYRIEKVEH